MNGTVLSLVDEIAGSGDEDPALLLSSDEQVFRLPPEASDSLQLGYACSVHRGQGIELPIAVIVAHQQAGAFFLRREMLYTAVTRAKLATVIVGTRDVIARAARTPDTDNRYSRLGDRLLAERGPTPKRVRRVVPTPGRRGDRDTGDLGHAADHLSNRWDLTHRQPGSGDADDRDQECERDPPS